MALGADAAVAPSGGEESNGIEEITVTAQRRTENVQNVPVSVSSVTAAALEKATITDVQDIAVSLPAVTLTNTNGYLTSSIRGVGGNSVGPGVENQVALYIDDVYYGSPAGSLLSLNNMQQIDVLKGPQGTLFGRNATGGVIQITTRDPGNELTGEVKASYGDYNNTFGSAYLGGAIIPDVLKADIAIEGHHQGNGWGTNIYNGDQVYNIDYEYAWRSKVLFDPIEGTRFTLIVDYTNTRNTLETLLLTPGRISGFNPAAGLTPDRGYNADFNGPDLHQGWGAGVSLKFEQELGPIELVNIAAYRRSLYNFDFDYDVSPANIENIYARQKDRQFSEEFRLQSASPGKFKWVVGAFYFDARAGWNNFLLQSFPAGLNITVRNFQTTSSTAGFGQAAYEFLPDTNLTVGARYTSETKAAVDGSTTLGVVGPGDGPQIATRPAADAELHATKSTYRVSLDHRFNDQLMAYVSYNTGFKSGGFNTGGPGTAPYLPETLDAAEVGIKTDFLDKRIRIDVSAFHYKYNNIQVQQLAGGAIATINGAGAKLYGIDSDIIVAVTNNFRITSGLGWNHPDFTSFPNCPFVPPQGGVPSIPADCAGHRIPLASDFTGNIAGDLTVPLPMGSLDLNANLYYNSGFFFTPDNNTEQGAYAQVSASGTWTAPDGRLSVGAWGKNLTDKRVATYESVNTGNGTFNLTYQAPRMYGLTVGYKF